MRDKKPHLMGIALFLFIPLVLFLFLRFPFGVMPSFALAITIMVSHRFVAIPFMNRFRHKRCLWCGRTGFPRESMEISAGKIQVLELCKNTCVPNALRFFDFCVQNRILLRVGIFIPLVWYVFTTPLIELNKFPLYANLPFYETPLS